MDGRRSIVETLGDRGTVGYIHESVATAGKSCSAVGDVRMGSCGAAINDARRRFSAPAAAAAAAAPVMGVQRNVVDICSSRRRR